MNCVSKMAAWKTKEGSMYSLASVNLLVKGGPMALTPVLLLGCNVLVLSRFP